VQKKSGIDKGFLSTVILKNMFGSRLSF